MTIWDEMRAILGEDEAAPKKDPAKDAKPEPPPKDRIDTYKVQELIKKIEVHASELHKGFDELRRHLSAATRYLKDVPELRGALDTVLRDFSEVKSLNLPQKVQGLNQVLNLLDQAARIQRSKVADVATR
jgi:hypothetical protein